MSFKLIVMLAFQTKQLIGGAVATQLQKKFKVSVFSVDRQTDTHLTASFPGQYG